GTSGGGKSTLATALLEQLAGRGYQFCIVDPEGDYRELEAAVALGDAAHAPALDEVGALLGRPAQNAVVDPLGVSLADRPGYFAALLPALLELRARSGRPHWILIDEAHHLLPADRSSAALDLPRDPHGFLLVTVHPGSVARPLLESVQRAIAVGA